MELAKEHSAQAQQRMKLHYDQKARENGIEAGDRVFLRNMKSRLGFSKKLELPWSHQFRVVDVTFPHALIVPIGAPMKAPKKVNLNHLKKCFEITGPAETADALPDEVRDALAEVEINEMGDSEVHDEHERDTHVGTEAALTVEESFEPHARYPQREHRKPERYDPSP